MACWQGTYTNSAEIATLLEGRVRITGESSSKSCGNNVLTVSCQQIEVLGKQAEASVDACLCEAGYVLPLSLSVAWVREYIAGVVNKAIICEISCLRPTDCCTDDEENAIFFGDLSEKYCRALGQFCKYIKKKILDGETIPSDMQTPVICAGSYDLSDCCPVVKTPDAFCIQW